MLMPMSLPTEADVLAMMESLSNWGRWGPEDELGTLNLITPEARKRGVGEVREGHPASPAWVPSPGSDPLGGGIHRLMIETGEVLHEPHRCPQDVVGESQRSRFALEYVG